MSILDKVDMIPWISLDDKPNTEDREYFKEIAARKLDIDLICSQPERLLSQDDFFSRKDDNPNCQLLDGSYEKRVSPFGQSELWTLVGNDYIKKSGIHILQHIYRDIPNINIVSNNEHPKLRWKDAEKYLDITKRYHNYDYNMLREMIMMKYRYLYKNLFRGLRNGFKNNRNVMFTGYNANIPQFVGRYNDWDKYSYHMYDDVNPWASVWNGTSASCYTDDNGATDYTLWSTQVEFMNLVDIVNQYNSFEVSVWHGGQKQIDKYLALGQTYDLDRYEGWIKYVVFLLLPHKLRAFFPHSDSLETNLPYFNRLMDITNYFNKYKITKWDTLNTHLAFSTLLEYGPHPYRYNLPNGWNARAYMKLPAYNKPKDLHTPIDVFYCVRQYDDTFYVYAHAPLGVKKQMIELPHKTVEIEATPKGDLFIF